MSKRNKTVKSPFGIDAWMPHEAQFFGIDRTPPTPEDFARRDDAIKKRMQQERDENRAIIENLEKNVIQWFRDYGDDPITPREKVFALLECAETDEEREKILSWIRKLSMPNELAKLKVLL